MSIRLLVAVLIIASLNHATVLGQTVPIGALPTEYNGGFAGEAGAARVTILSSLKHSPGDGTGGFTSKSTVVSIDQFFKKIRSGVAVTAGLFGTGRHWNGWQTSASISPKLSFKGKYTLAPFVGGSYTRGNLSYSDYTPSDILTLHSLAIKTGFLINSNRSYIGLSTDIANYSTQFAAVDGNLLFAHEKWVTFQHTNLTLQTGYSFQKYPDSKFSFTPQLSILYHRYKYSSIPGQEVVRRNVITLMDVNLMFRYDKMIAGINSSGIVLGYQTPRFKLQVTNFYSNERRTGKPLEIGDHTFINRRPDSNNFGARRLYTGSISVRYVFKGKESVKMSGF